MVNVSEPDLFATSFSSDLFVGRSQYLDHFQQWTIEKKPAKRFIILFGSMGIGKSWLLNMLCEVLRGKGQYVIWIDLSPGTVEPLTGKAFADLLSTRERQLDWLSQINENAAAIFGRHIIDINQTNHFEPMFDEFVRRLCERKPRAAAAPLLIIDGFEDLSDDLRRFISNLIAIFHTHGSTRILMASREKVQLENQPLNFLSESSILEGLSDEEVWEQVRRRLAQGDQHLQQAGQAIRRYLTNTPFINTQLAERALQRENGVLTVADLQECLNACLQRAGLQDRPEEQDLLHRLAITYPDGWTARQFRASEDKPVEHPHLTTLSRAGVVILRTDGKRAVAPDLQRLIHHLRAA